MTLDPAVEYLESWMDSAFNVREVELKKRVAGHVLRSEFRRFWGEENGPLLLGHIRPMMESLPDVGICWELDSTDDTCMCLHTSVRYSLMGEPMGDADERRYLSTGMINRGTMIATPDKNVPKRRPSVTQPEYQNILNVQVNDLDVTDLVTQMVLAMEDEDADTLRGIYIPDDDLEL